MPVEYLQIIKNGAVDAEVRLAEWKRRKAACRPSTFDDSGWFLVRAVTSNPKTLPIRLQRPVLRREGRPAARQPRSVQFFLDWIDAAERRIRKLPKLDDAERESLLAEQASAREFFEELLATANAE